jgi:UDP-3-O-[3-hydroxymyristoyl] glucosamine N-acyltransferase
MSFISKNAEIDESTFIGENVILLGNVIIEQGVIIEDGCAIGKPSDAQFEILKKRKIGRLSYEDYDKVVDTKTVIKKNCNIGRYSTIYSGSILQKDVICKEYSLIRWNTTVGNNSKLMYRSQIHSWVTAGIGCRIGGFCCNDSEMGNYVSMFGNLLHSYREYGGGRRELAPRLGDKVVIGFGSQIIGDVCIGDNAYVAAGAIVTEDVPPNTIVTLLDDRRPLRTWKGRLREIRGNEEVIGK